MGLDVSVRQKVQTRGKVRNIARYANGNGGRVYFVAAGRFVKIGFAEDVPKRLASMQTGCPDALELLGAITGGIAREREIHEFLKRWHYRGEWFRLNATVRRSIAAICKYDAEQQEKKEKLRALFADVRHGTKQNAPTGGAMRWRDEGSSC